MGHLIDELRLAVCDLLEHQDERALVAQGQSHPKVVEGRAVEANF